MAPPAPSLRPLKSCPPSLDLLRRLLAKSGPEALGWTELVALLIEQDTPCPLETAASLCEQAGRLATLRPFRPRALARLTGVPESAALRLLVCAELARRWNEALAKERQTVLTPAKVFDWAHPKLTSLVHEEVWALCLDGSGRLTSSFQVSRGGIGSTSILPRDILGPVLRESAAGFLLVHNHPSGDPTPSRQDQEMTDALARAAAVCGTPLVDHVVVARDGYVSLMSA